MIFVEYILIQRNFIIVIQFACISVYYTKIIAHLTAICVCVLELQRVTKFNSNVQAFIIL